MRNIGINVNAEKDSDGHILNLIKKVIESLIKDPKITIFKDATGINEETVKGLDFMISLGGDGTLLGTAREIYRYNLPILGVNIGNLGFLTEVESSEFSNAISNIRDGKYNIEERIMLNCSVENESVNTNFICLNDTVVSKGTLSRMAKYDIYIDDKFYSSFTADGVIISTPTGSTAYSLSAGGPIMYPTLSLMSITPICPHSIGARTIVIDSNSKVNIAIRKKHESMFLTVDGQQSMELFEESKITVTSLPWKCRLIKLENYDYFNILRKKITLRSKECEGGI